jgi:hypothetical protein
MKIAPVRFSCSNEWVDACFQKMERWQPSIESVHTDIEVLPWVLGFLIHDSFDSFECYWTNALKFAGGGCSGLVENLSSVGIQSGLSGMVGAARKITTLRASVRTGGMRINTENSFSRDFLPPGAIDARRAVDRLFAGRGRSAGNTIGIGQSLASYMIFLTAHPLTDGNGRTARMLFASDCVRRSAGSASHEILGLILFHRNRGSMLHLSARCARAGDMGMLASCYDQALKRSRDELGDGLHALGRAISAGTDQVRTVCRDIHAFLEFELKSLI